MDYLNSSLSSFTKALASPSAVPGGGGASALAGALGAALGDMVGELTVGKQKYADREVELLGLMARAQALRSRLLRCVQKDAAAFAPLARAYTIPKDDPTRTAVMERCLRDAASVPLEIMELCAESIEVLRRFADLGSPIVLSDAAAGAALCRGAIQGAAVNVYVNTRLMQDRDRADALNRRADELLERSLPLADQIYEDVHQKLL